MSPHALGKRPARVRRSLPKTTLLPPSVVGTFLADVVNDVDVLLELNGLVRCQERRVDRLLALEHELGLLLPQGTREVAPTSQPANASASGTARHSTIHTNTG